MKNEYHLNRSYFQNPLQFGYIRLLQIGRLFCNKDTEIDTHIHLDLFELTVVTGGRGIVTTNGVSVLVEKGDIYFSLPGDAHKIRSDEERPLKYDFLAFRCDKEELRKELEYISVNYRSPHNRIFHDERIRSLVGNALAEFQQESVYSEELLLGILQQIIIYTIRAFREIDPEVVSGTVTHGEALCWQMMNYIDTHMYSLKKLEEMARDLDYSYGYLSALFKKVTGNTLLDYYQEKRLDAARLLLLEQKFRIVEIAELLNYASVYSFSKAFSGYYGLSPRKYLTKHKKQGGEESLPEKNSVY